MFNRKFTLLGVKIRPIFNGLVKRTVKLHGFKYVGSVRIRDDELIPRIESEISAGGYGLVKVGELYYCPTISDVGRDFSDCDVFVRKV